MDSYTLQQSVVFSWCLGKEMKLRMMLFLCNATYAPVFCFFLLLFFYGWAQIPDDCIRT